MPLLRLGAFCTLACIKRKPCKSVLPSFLCLGFGTVLDQKGFKEKQIIEWRMSLKLEVSLSGKGEKDLSGVHADFNEHDMPFGLDA